MTANTTPSVSTIDSAATKTIVHTGDPVWAIVVGLRASHLLHQHVVFPAVPEVIRVANPATVVRDPIQLDLRLVRELGFPVRVGVPVANTIDLELVRVRVGPPHRGLDHFMQLGQCHVARYQ